MAALFHHNESRPPAVAREVLGDLHSPPAAPVLPLLQHPDWLPSRRGHAVALALDLSSACNILLLAVRKASFTSLRSSLRSHFPNEALKKSR